MKLLHGWHIFMMILILLASSISGGSAGAVVDWLYLHVPPHKFFTTITWEGAVESDQIGYFVQLRLAGIENLPTPTPTLTPSPTTTATCTPTTTLEPVSVPKLIFPAFSPTTVRVTETATVPSAPTAIYTLHNTESPQLEARSQPLIITLISLWVVLALFLLLGMRAIKGSVGKE